MTSPVVSTTYADGSTNTVRPETRVYPNGRTVSFDYGTAGGMNDRLSRIESLDDGTALAEYQYLGLGAVVQQDSPEADLRSTLVSLTGTNDPDTGDIYSGLDRFGRVTDVRWRDVSANSDLSRVQYGYDRASNRTFRKNSSDPNHEHDWQYGYDGLQRLKTADRGTLTSTSGSGLSTLDSPLFSQCWSLDATGNWAGFNQANTGNPWSLVQARTANAVNEITGITNSVGSAWAQPAYDPAGNMTTIPQPDNPTGQYTATYDAWNRLVKLVDPATGHTVQESVYDARGYRIVKKTYTGGTLSETRHYYYTNGWRCVEERVGTSPDSAAAERQHVWGVRYIDDLVVRDRSVTGTLDERLYACQDGNWNITAVVATDGTVQERYEYDPYGQLSVLAPDFTPRSSSSCDWNITYAGYRFDTSTGLYLVRFRFLHLNLGWIARDPSEYFADRNLYGYFGGPNAIDPTGMLLIAIDGTGTEKWLTSPQNPQQLPNGRWLSHVRNFYKDYDGNRGYWYGPKYEVTGWDVSSILNGTHKWACEQWCKTKEPIDIVGWSRGGLVAILLAKKLQDEGCNCGGCVTKNIPVRFLGLYDPVDMCPGQGSWNNATPGNVQGGVHIYGDNPPSGGKPGYTQDGGYQGRDYNNWTRISTGFEGPSQPWNYHLIPMNCTHGAIGGCPGYSATQPSPYDWNRDRDRSIQADRWMREGADACGLPIRVLQPDEYGFPSLQSGMPPIKPPPAIGPTFGGPGRGFFH